MTETIIAAAVGTVVGGLILAAVIALVRIVWRKALLRVRRGWQRLRWHSREWAIRRLKKAIAKKLKSEGGLRVGWQRYESVLGETHRGRLDLFNDFQLNTRIAPSDYKIARALESLVAERKFHKVREEPFGFYVGTPQYVFTYHSGGEASYDVQQQLLESEAACMEYNSNTQGFSDACPEPRYQLYNASDKPNQTRLAIKKREDGPEHCARCWEMRDQASKAAME